MRFHVVINLAGAEMKIETFGGNLEGITDLLHSSS